MRDEYSLSWRQGRICRWAAALFLLVGAIYAVGVLVGAAVPGTAFHCDPTGCTAAAQPDALLPDDVRRSLSQPGAQTRFDTYAARLPVRLGLAGIVVLTSLPFLALVLCVGIALRQLAAERGVGFGRALPWLRRAAAGAVAMVFATPTAHSLYAMLLSPGTPAKSSWYLIFEVDQAAFGLLLAVAAYVVTWALEAGTRAQRDLADFV